MWVGEQTQEDARRWAMMLYNLPISMGVDYFVNNPFLGGGRRNKKTAILDKNAGCFLKHKEKAKVGESEKSILNGENYDPAGYEWMFTVLWDKFRDHDGVPIVRIAGKLGGVGEVIRRELEAWVRNPAGAWGRVGKKRRGIKALDRHLTNREVYNYFKDRTIVKSHKLSGVIE